MTEKLKNLKVCIYIIIVEGKKCLNVLSFENIISVQNKIQTLIITLYKS